MVNCVVIVLLLSIAFLGSEGGNTKNVKFTFGKRSCIWDEQIGFQGQDRTLMINCPAHGKDAQIKCQYLGDPHDCKTYSGKEKEYYACLVRQLVKDGRKGPCDLEMVSCSSGAFSQCGNVYFKKKKSSKDVKRKGTFKDGKRSCDWEEEDDGRTLGIKCPKKGNKAAATCKYSGNPQSCKTYSGKENEYYQCLAETLAKKGNNGPCEPAKVSCGTGQFSQCGGVYFQKKKSHWSFSAMLQYVMRNFEDGLELYQV